MTQALKIHHDLADVAVTHNGKVSGAILKRVISSALDQYLIEARIPAEAVHKAMRKRLGDYYLSAGFCLRVYRRRSDMNQAELAMLAGIGRHHLSEMENNKRAVDEADAKNLAEILDCDYRKLMSGHARRSVGSKH